MANRLALTLKERGILQEDLAMDLGVNPATISRWCTNQAQPTTDYLYQISSILEVGFYDLLYNAPFTLKISPNKPVKLSTLKCNDAFLALAFGKSTLPKMDSAILRFTSKIEGNIHSNPILLQSSIYQNPKIPIIEINRVITNIKSTVLNLENCKEELTLAFNCPNLSNLN